MEILRNFDLIEMKLPISEMKVTNIGGLNVPLPQIKKGAGYRLLKIMETEAYIELFKKYIPTSIYGDKNEGEPNIQYAKICFTRLNAMSDDDIDKFADCLMTICNKHCDELGKEHIKFDHKNDVFLHIKPTLFIIKKPTRTDNTVEQFYFEIENEEYIMNWFVNGDGSLGFY